MKNILCILFGHKKVEEKSAWGWNVYCSRCDRGLPEHRMIRIVLGRPKMNEPKKRNVTVTTKEERLIRLFVQLYKYPNPRNAKAVAHEVLSPEQDREVEQE